MIVRKKLELNKAIYYLWKPVFIASLVAFSVCIGYDIVGNKNLGVSPITSGMLGTAIAILLGFRNNSAYDRWWEARRLWGALVNDSRTFARQTLTFLSLKHYREGDEQQLKTIQKELIYRQIAFVYALKHHLRKQDPIESIKPFLSQDEIEHLKKEQNIPNALIHQQGKRLQDIQEMGYIEDFRHMQMDTKLSALCDVLGGCERIKNTIFPRQYSFYTSIFVWIFVLMLPFTLVKELGYFTILATAAIGLIFFVLDKMGYNIETPFENTVNDIPMTALSRTIEINLRQQLGETDLPEPVVPVNGYLF